MPSSATSPHKSRLFNLINRQSIRWRDRLDSSARHLKVMVEWGAQILLYPVYLLVQAGRVAGRQLGQVVENSRFLSLPGATDATLALASDRPIEEVLEAIRPSQDLSVQGIASSLENRQLVLVTPENAIANALSPEQQQTLDRQIRLALANYCYERRLQHAAAQKFPSLAPTFASNRDHVLPPVRFFWKVVRWMQTGSVAIAVNLFGESTLARQHSPLSQPTPSSLSAHAPVLLSHLDSAVAELETHPSRWVVALAQSLREGIGKLTAWVRHSLKPAQAIDPPSTSPSWEIQALIQAALDYFFGKPAHPALPSSPSDGLSPLADKQAPALATSEPPAPSQPSRALSRVQQLRGWLQALKARLMPLQPSAAVTQTRNPDPFRIQAIIWAALDYFFSQHREKRQIQAGATSATPALAGHTPVALPNSVLAAEPWLASAEEDPWLSWDDLFREIAPRGETRPEGNAHRSQSRTLPAAPPLPHKPGSSLQKHRQRASQQRQQPHGLSVKKNRPKALARKPKGSQPIATPSSSKHGSPEHAPDWIETQATPTGYVKHPLEHILEWLDRLILWLEDAIANLWHWLRQWLRQYF
jgi:hypothetical protein